MKQLEPDANATIQLDRAMEQLDEIQLEEPEAPLPKARLTPPPLPTSSLPPIVPRVSEAAAPRSAGKSMAFGVLFVALLGGAIFGGLRVAGALRPKAIAPAAPPPVVAPVVQAAPAPEPATSAAPAVLTLPTVEMNDPPAETK